MKRTASLLITFLLYSSIAFSQKFDGLYTGIFTGDVEGSFEFTIDSKYYNNLEGTWMIKGGPVKIIYGMVKADGTVDAYFFDKKSDLNQPLMRGTFRGKINTGPSAGSYEMYDATFDNPHTSKGEWTTKETIKDKGPILSYITTTGQELPFSEEKPFALRIKIKLTDPYLKDYSIQSVTLGARNPQEGRYAPDIDPLDNFYVYTGNSKLEIQPKAGAKEVDYIFEYAYFGNKLTLLLPKKISAVFYITLKNEKSGEIRKETLNAEASISSLCVILVNKCGYGECPSINNKKITKGKKATAVSGDELLIPMEAELWINFLDGTVGYFVNKSPSPWKLTMQAGHFSSTQHWSYTENSLTIQAIATKGMEKGGETISDKAMEEGLKLLVKKGASASAPGLVMQVAQFFGATKSGGDATAIRIRSKLEVSFYTNGTFRIRNLEGSPEISRPQNTPLALPVGKEVTINIKGQVSSPVAFSNANQPVQKIPVNSWAGVWQTQWGKMTLVQNGNKASGTYEHDNGKITGTVTGNKFTGTWSEAPGYKPPDDAGDVEFILSADGKNFTGRWRYGKKGEWQTGWNGQR